MRTSKNKQNPEDKQVGRVFMQWVVELKAIATKCCRDAVAAGSKKE